MARPKKSEQKIRSEVKSAPVSDNPKLNDNKNDRAPAQKDGEVNIVFVGRGIIVTPQKTTVAFDSRTGEYKCTSRVVSEYLKSLGFKAKK